MEAPQRTQKKMNYHLIQESYRWVHIRRKGNLSERKISWKTILPPLFLVTSPTIVKNRNNLSFYQLVNG